MNQETLHHAHGIARQLLAGLVLLCLLSAVWQPVRAAPAPSSATTTATTFVTLLAKGDFAAAERFFSPTLQAAAPVATLRLIWDGLIARYGAFERQAGAAVQQAAGAQNVVVRCVFARDTADLVVSIQQDGKIGGLHVTNVQPSGPATYTPPGYVNPASFHERAVTVGSAPWALPGTLTLPDGHGPFPAVVLVAGSGPEDRDETIDGDKPFRDLAWGLASRGIAVLRYDKRTLVYGAQIARLTTLFHPFIPVPPGSPPGLATPAAYSHPGHVDPRVIQDIVTWLHGAKA